MKILMVCLGNICRSPIAEGVMHDKLIRHNINGTVDSAGVISFHAGEPPDKRAIAIAKQNNVDISTQRARQFTDSDFNNFDLILTMDQSVHSEIVKKAKNDKDRSKVKLFLSYSDSTDITNVPDPYWGGAKGFEDVFNMIDKSCDSILTKIINHNI